MQHDLSPAELTVCYLLFDYFTDIGKPTCEGTCTIYMLTCKNDIIQQRHFPALGRSQDQELDLVQQLKVWLHWMRF